MTHWRSTSEMLSAACAEGSAMLMTVASRATISWATEMHPRVSHRRDDASGGDVTGTGASVRASVVTDISLEI